NYDWENHIGTIEKGKFADIIAVAGNPVADVTEMERVKFVMKGGAIVRNDLAGGSRWRRAARAAALDVHASSGDRCTKIAQREAAFRMSNRSPLSWRLALVLTVLAPLPAAAEDRHACAAEAFTTVCRDGARELRVIQDTTSPSRRFGVAWQAPDAPG